MYSIIVCTHNNAQMLKATLFSIFKIDIGHLDVELVVINNGSHDDTRLVLEEFKRICPFSMRYFDLREPGLASARNRGVREAKGDTLIFTDDDVLFDREFLTSIHNTFLQTNALAVGGRILLKYPNIRPEWLSDKVDYMYGRIDLGESDCIFPRDMTPLGPSMAIKKRAFESYGYFDESLGLKGASETILRGEESELLSRLAKANETIIYSGKSIVYHVVREERLKKEWFVERFRNSGIMMAKSVSCLSLSWWKCVCKYIVAMVGSWVLLVNKRSQFYYECKAIYFAKIIGGRK